MEKEFKIIMDERAYDTIPLQANVIKTTDEIIYQFAKHYNLDYDVAVDVIIEYAAQHDDFWKLDLGKEHPPANNGHFELK